MFVSGTTLRFPGCSNPRLRFGTGAWGTGAADEAAAAERLREVSGGALRAPLMLDGMVLGLSLCV